jgi:hypothetical protein
MRFRRLIAGFALMGSCVCALSNAPAGLADDRQDHGTDGLQASDASGIIASELIAVAAPALPKPVAGSLTIKVATAGHDGSFDFVSSVPGVAAFTLTTYAGAASKSLLNVTPGAYMVVQTKNAAGFELQAVQCSGASFDGAVASVSIVSGASSTCTFSQAPSSASAKPPGDDIGGHATSLKADVSGEIFGLNAYSNGAGRFARAGIAVALIAVQSPSLP